MAVVLSLLEPGLGHIYCGRIAKGFVIACVFSVFLPFIYINLVVCESRIRIEVLALYILNLLLLTTAAIDSYRIARKTRPDYELKDYNRWYIYLVFLLLAKVGLEQVTENFRSNYIEAFREHNITMFPTVSSGDLLLANKTAYKTEDPKRGDLIVFISPENRREIYFKRVTAVAGDIIEMKDNQLLINGEKLERKSRGRTTYIDKDSNKKEIKVEGELLIEKNGQVEYMIFLGDIYNSKSFPDDHRAYFPETMVPKNHCFVLGDNRNLSEDSRQYGSVPLATIKGRVEYLYWPAKSWSRFGKIK